MGRSCITRNTYSILSLHLLLILIITPSSYSFAPTDFVTKHIINKLCSQSTILSGGFCAKWLNADPRTTSMNIQGLIELTSKKAQEFGMKNLEIFMNDLARSSSNNKQLKNAYKTCANSYVIAIEELEEARCFLSNSSFRLAYYATSKALDYAYACKDQFDGPSSEPPLVLDRSKKFITMCRIARDFASLFD